VLPVSQQVAENSIRGRRGTLLATLDVPIEVSVQSKSILIIWRLDHEQHFSRLAIEIHW
jgi:hypothetical protein